KKQPGASTYYFTWSNIDCTNPSIRIYRPPFHCSTSSCGTQFAFVAPHAERLLLLLTLLLFLLLLLDFPYLLVGWHAPPTLLRNPAQLHIDWLWGLFGDSGSPTLNQQV